MYDFLFITNIPSFYKINLYNLLAKHYKIKVIFVSPKSNIRADDFYSGEMNFDHLFINDEPYETRNKVKSFARLVKSVYRTKYKKIIFPGWEVQELLIISLLTPKCKNCVAVESSILETKKTPIIWWLKKMFIGRMSTGLPSGELQAEIFKEMKFSGHLILTNGVGVLNNTYYQNNFSRTHNEPDAAHILSYLYVGRLAEEKNLDLMCSLFCQEGKKLTIVGYGPLEKALKNKYGSKINFIGAINNHELKQIYLAHDVFVLPSKSEPWGLVIEEALCSGLVIIASDMVGCKKELVVKINSGIVFNHLSQDSLHNAIKEVESNFSYYKANVLTLDKISLLEERVKPYAEMLD